jgi:hypothetical protein
MLARLSGCLFHGRYSRFPVHFVIFEFLLCFDKYLVVDVEYSGEWAESLV